MVMILASTSLLIAFHNRGDTYPIEAKFTDRSPHGIAIVPASGASDPCPNTLGVSGDGGGFNLVPNTYNARVYAQLLNFCIISTSTYTYFLPARTQAELQSFYNAGTAASGLPQVKIFTP